MHWSGRSIDRFGAFGWIEVGKASGDESEESGMARVRRVVMHGGDGGGGGGEDGCVLSN